MPVSRLRCGLCFFECHLRDVGEARVTEQFQRVVVASSSCEQADKASVRRRVELDRTRAFVL
jgi:hypothetical protein